MTTTPTLVTDLDQAQVALRDLRQALRAVLDLDVLHEAQAELEAALIALDTAHGNLQAARPTLVARFGAGE